MYIASMLQRLVPAFCVSWARPYLGGQAVETAMSNASEKYTGSGEALGWFALPQPGEIDEVRTKHATLGG